VLLSVTFCDWRGLADRWQEMQASGLARQLAGCADPGEIDGLGSVAVVR